MVARRRNRQSESPGAIEGLREGRQALGLDKLFTVGLDSRVCALDGGTGARCVYLFASLL